MRFGKTVEWLADSFGSRLHLIHQEQLRMAPRTTYSMIARFLGAKGNFPADMAFGRYSGYKGHRTDLCFKASLRRTLKQRFEEDYEAIERAFVAKGLRIPNELRLRRTRCD